MPEEIQDQFISLIGSGQDSEHGSREQRIWRFRERLDRHSILESIEQTGLHGSQFERLPELARARWRSFGVRRAERGGSGDGILASASRGKV